MNSAAQVQSDVVIVGAGAAGCTIAMLLARYGIRSILLERRVTPLVHPAAHVINGRTQEIWHQASPAMAQRIAALGPQQIEDVGNIRWCTRLRGETLGELALFEDLDRIERVRGHSPYRISHIGQHILTPVLWQSVEAEPLVDFRRGVRLVSITNEPERVVLQLADEKGQTSALSTRYLVAADGANSTIRDQIGVSLRGPVLANMGSAFFHAQLDAVLPRPRPLISWIYNHEFCGVLITHDNDDYVLMTAFLTPDQEVAVDRERYWQRMIPVALGVPNLDFTMRSTGTWMMTAQTAERFRDRNVLLIGDAAHRFPHTGGYGLNSGVQDAHNLAWKLAAVLEGTASESLLNTYEEERRPVIERFAEQSVSNHFKLDQVTKPIGLTNEALHRATKAFVSPPLSWLPARVRGSLADGMMKLGLSRARIVSGSGAKARALREEMGRQIALQLEHFVSTGMEFGYCYRSSLIRSESGTQPVLGEGVVDYLPTTWPGARLPHALVRQGEEAVPLHDLLSLRGLSLLTFDPASWSLALGCSERAGLSALHVVGLQEVPGAARADLVKAYEVGEHGALLVRPDAHVMWRTSLPAAQGAAELLRTVSQLLAAHARARPAQDGDSREHAGQTDAKRSSPV